MLDAVMFGDDGDDIISDDGDDIIRDDGDDIIRGDGDNIIGDDGDDIISDDGDDIIRYCYKYDDCVMTAHRMVVMMMKIRAGGDYRTNATFV